ncbi:VOC family protein [Flavobacterium faecale]|uniref:VOC family protein n=1 Tax=Flavobacterium faecale TaxID=1355330 RepID=UPI003AACA6B7
MKNENPVVWFEIYTDDLARAKTFYENVFKFTMSEIPMPDTGENMQMLFFPGDMDSKNRATGALVQMEGFKAGNNSTVVYFMSEDCSIEQGRVEKAGGKIVKPKMSIGEYGFIVLASDTEGNMIGIHSMK